jgi:hypothetical protein
MGVHMRRLLIAFGLLCAIAVIAPAQTVGEITGEVRDPSGATTPNAAVTATNTATDVGRATTTNAAGFIASQIWHRGGTW